MAIEIRQGLRQQQTLSPQIQQAIKILTLARTELEEFIAEEIKDNPFLEEGQQETDERPEEKSIDAVKFLEEQAGTANDERGIEELFSRFTDALSSFDEKNNTSNNSEESQQPIYELIKTGQETLHDHLEDQLHMMHLTAYELECCQKVLQYLNEQGYLDIDLEHLSSEENIHIDDIKFAVSVLQKCEPIGIAARTVQESLLLQLASKEKIPHFVESILRDHWKEFEKIDVAKIAKSLKATPEQIKTAFAYIRANLDPKPARQFGDERSEAMVPDVYVFKRDDHWTVSVNEDGLPRLKLSKKYEDLIQQIVGDKKNADTKNFLQQKFKNASWILRSLGERNKTILKVAEVIVERQVEFFEKGTEFLKPLTLKKIADELGLHESTISRSTSNKYIHTPRGLFELKYFFNSGLESDEGGALANEAIKVWISEFIKNEDPKHPLSDQDIAELIAKEKSMNIARRTVAKYRESIGIASSSKRVKRF